MAFILTLMKPLLNSFSSVYGNIIISEYGSMMRENVSAPSAPVTCLPILQPLEKHAELPLVPEDAGT